MLADLKNSMNMSNEYRSKQLYDPINYQVDLRGDKEELSEIPLRFMYKDRKIKEVDSFGSYRFNADKLKKRTNPTEEYRKQLEEQLRLKKQILSEYEMNGGHLSQEQIKSFKKNASLRKNNSAFNIYDVNDLEDINERAENVEYYQNLSANENLIKVLDCQLNLLRKQSHNQFKTLSKSSDFKNKSEFYKAQRYENMLNTDEEDGLQEPKVQSQFLAVNDNRVQHLKHVITQQKPEYIPLEELEKIKQEHEKELLDIEDEYYGRKKISLEELNRRRHEKQKLLRNKQLYNMIKRPGYNNDNPLEKHDYEFINKYNNYLMNKQKGYDKLGYEEEWNATRVKSLNANGIIDRNDGLPGYLDQDDYRLYYYDINDVQELNFERPLKVHKHTGRENTLKRTFRNEPGYETTKGKFYRTISAPDINKISTNNNNNMYNNNNNFNTINESIYNKDFVNNGDGMFANKTINLENNQNEQFMKLIFGMLTKNEKGEVPKNKIISEMKLDENAIIEMGFKSKNDFENKLSNFPSKDPKYMTEEEFYSFILQKKETPQSNSSPVVLNENKLYHINYPPESRTIEVDRQQIQNNNDEILPGMSTSYFDFLKNPSTGARLRHINKTLKKSKRSQSALDNSATKYKLHKSSILRKNRLNRTFDNDDIDNNMNYSNTNNYASNEHFNINNYHRKSDLNFTIPKPFEFLKEDYHGKKLLKMKEILEERRKNENDIFKHNFHANPLNKRMFNRKGDLRNIIEREKSARQRRIEQKKMEIIAGMRPFSFYDNDLKSFVERKNQECIPPKFVPFKANPIQYKSQVNVYEGKNKYSKEARQERIHKRALSMFNAASLPPRMEMHEKQKKLQEKEKLIIEKQKKEIDKNKRVFKAKQAPNFNILHEKFINILEKKKRSACPTIPKPFTFHEPKKKPDLCSYMDQENNPKNKNPKKFQSIEVIRKKMQKKPKIEPPSTRSLKLLMDTRRRELENRKIREESIRKEDEKRRTRQSRLNNRVRSSSVIQGNKKQLEEKRKQRTKDFIENLKNDEKNYNEKLDLMYQKVNNMPLMMESIVQKKPVENMKQNESK